MLRKLCIEPTTKCNLNYKMCFRHTWFDEPICDLSLEDFRSVLETMPRTVETVFFGGMGEPLFHRDILTMVRLAAQTGAEVELLTNGYTYLHHIRRKITHCSFGNIREQALSDIWTTEAYKTFRRKYDCFEFASCLYCGHCELFEENREDCIGNTHPACGGCLWAEGVLSCP